MCSYLNFYFCFYYILLMLLFSYYWCSNCVFITVEFSYGTARIAFVDDLIWLPAWPSTQPNTYIVTTKGNVRCYVSQLNNGAVLIWTVDNLRFLYHISLLICLVLSPEKMAKMIRAKLRFDKSTTQRRLIVYDENSCIHLLPRVNYCLPVWSLTP